jgi:hypothetical protein
LITKIPLVREYIGLNFTLRCEAEIPGSQLSGIQAAVEWMKNDIQVSTSNDRRIILGDTVEDSPGREFRRSIEFTPLSADDMGTYSCSATIRPTVANSEVTNGFGIGNNSLTVVGKFSNNCRSFLPYIVLLCFVQYPLWMSLSIVLVSLFESLTSLPSMASLSPAQPPLELLGHQHQSENR